MLGIPKHIVSHSNNLLPLRKASCIGVHSSWQTLQQHLWRLRLPRELCLKIMRLEPCTRQFSIRTPGKYNTDRLKRTSRENSCNASTLSPVSVFIRDRTLGRIRATRYTRYALHAAAKPDDFRKPPSTASRLSRCPVCRKRRTSPSSDRFVNTMP